MRERLFLGALLLTGLVMPITGCTNSSGLDSIQVNPATPSVTAGQSVQLSAVGTYGNGSHPTTQDVTSGVTWTSSNPSVATITASGLATTLTAGTTTITASATGFKGPLTATATLTATSSTTGGGTAGGVVTSISVIPSAQTVTALNEQTQFIAIGTTSAGSTEILTTAVTWSSSTPAVATIGAATGIATSVGPGNTSITALYANSTTGSVVTGTASLSVTGGSTADVTTLTLLPSSETLSASGQTGQLVAIGAGGNGLQENVTSDKNIQWSSSMPSVAIVNASATPGGPAVPGLVQGVSAGTATIIAQYTNPIDATLVTASATVTVTATPAPEPILSLSIIPSSITVLNLLGTGNFLAVATYSTAPYVRDVTNSPTTAWLSSAPEIFPVDTNSAGNTGASAGTVTAVGNGSATIIAESTNPSDSTIQTATATFNCPASEGSPSGPGNPGTPPTCLPGTQAPGLLVTLTVSNEGLNTTNWLVTAPSATGTQDVIHCGPGWIPTAQQPGTGSVCTATYPVGTTVTLTATQPTGATGTFGGWSDNCAINPNPSTQGGTNTCTITLDGTTNSNASIGAIFN